MELKEKNKGTETQADLPPFSLKEWQGRIVLINSISLDFLRKHDIFLFNLENNRFGIVVSPPIDWEVVENLERFYERQAVVYQASKEEIEQLIQEFYELQGGDLEEVTRSAEEEVDFWEEVDLEHLKDMASEAPVVRLVNLIIKKALERRASDIHFEPFEKDFRVRFRIDGVLHDVETPPKRLQAPILSRLKLMAKLNIAERRLPQDGRIKIKMGGNELDIRVSTLPTVFGESVVLRLLSKEEGILNLHELGLDEYMFDQFNSLIHLPYGIILVTGPTGSGKTTTLYAALSTINDVEKKIITVEDPVEYQLHGINQIQVKPQINLTFANVLRSILRQDPDVILIGEIRDRETAEIAVQASLTGHLVFSTLHTNDAIGAITRLRDMGTEAYLVSASLIGVLAQRLVRVLCPRCKALQPISPELKKRVVKEIGGNLTDIPSDLYQAKGCEYCAYTGYRGRVGIFELVPIDDDFGRLILKDTPENELEKLAQSKELRMLKQDGWEKVKRGITTLEEVLRVAQ